MPVPALADRTDVVDGPVAAIPSTALGNVAVARDGSGAVTYLKKVGGFDHVFVVRYVNGAFQAPEQIDSGVALPSSQPHVAAGNGGRLVVAFIQNAGLRAALAPAAGQPFTLSTGTVAAIDSAKSVDVAMSPAGIAYIAATSNDGGSSDDVRAARLVGATWTPVGTGVPANDVYPQPGGKLDKAIADEAGEPMSHPPKIAVSNDGNAVIAWGESAVAAEYDVYARRLTGTVAGPAQLASAPSLGGAMPAKTADQIAVAGDGAGTTWVTFRQGFLYPVNNNKGRMVVRRLVGSAFDAPQFPDGLPDPPPEAAEFPVVAVSASGTRGLFVTARQLTFNVFGGRLNAGTWETGAKLNEVPSDAPAFPTVAAGENGGVIAFAPRANMTTPTPAVVRAVSFLNSPGAIASSKTVSDVSLGGVQGGATTLSASADSAGNALVAWIQGGGAPADPRRVVVARINAPVSPPPPPPGGTDTTPPVITQFKASPATIAPGTTLPQVAVKKKAARLAKRTTISFTSTEAGTATLSFARLAAGRRKGKRCVASTRALVRARARRCTRRLVVKDTLSVVVKQNNNRVRFSGRLTAKRKLALGTYDIAIVASDAAKNASIRRTTKLTIKRR
jgi:hypothetical protein